MATRDELLFEVDRVKAKRAEVLTARSKATAHLERHETERGGLLLSGDKRAADANAREIAAARADVADCDAMLETIASQLVELADKVHDADFAAAIAEASEIETKLLPAARAAAADALRQYQARQAELQNLQAKLMTLISTGGGPTRPARRAELIR